MKPENLPEACRRIENVVIRLRRVLNELTSCLDSLNCCFQEFNESLPPEPPAEDGDLNSRFADGFASSLLDQSYEKYRQNDSDCLPQQSLQPD